ncbi:MAG TPA: hypothetical protein VGR87_02860 [Candidatus Limnocylindria bacterium]|jgi:hypothetical protein|nr:hypothetical protein [Candidatus Limnocylindria bacterium]
MRRSRSVCAVLLVALGLTGIGSPAAAAPPETVVLIDTNFLTLPDINCVSFTLHDTMLSERVQITTYFDSAGTPIQRTIHGNFQGVLTKSTGEAFADHAAVNLTFDLRTGRLTGTGLTFRYIRSGEGIIYAEIGRKVFDANGNLIFNAGPDDFTQGGFAALCEAVR